MTGLTNELLPSWKGHFPVSGGDRETASEWVALVFPYQEMTAAGSEVAEHKRLEAEPLEPSFHVGSGHSIPERGPLDLPDSKFSAVPHKSTLRYPSTEAFKPTGLDSSECLSETLSAS